MADAAEAIAVEGGPEYFIYYGREGVLMLTHYSVVAQPEINIGIRDINRIMSYYFPLLPFVSCG